MYNGQSAAELLFRKDGEGSTTRMYGLRQLLSNCTAMRSVGHEVARSTQQPKLVLAEDIVWHIPKGMWWSASKPSTSISIEVIRI